MALINEHHGIILLSQITYFRQGGHITIHAEHSVCDDELHTCILNLLQLGF